MSVTASCSNADNISLTADSRNETATCGGGDDVTSTAGTRNAPVVLECDKCHAPLPGEIGFVHCWGPLCLNCWQPWQEQKHYDQSKPCEVSCVCGRTIHTRAQPGYNYNWTYVPYRSRSVGWASEDGPQQFHYCSDACEVVARAQAREAAKVLRRVTHEPSTCATCREPFTATRRDADYCKPACRQKAYRERQRERERDRVEGARILAEYEASLGEAS